MYSGNDAGDIGVVAHTLIDILGDDVATAIPCKGKVKVGDAHSRDGVALKLFLNIALRPGLAHPYVEPCLDPEVADLIVRALVERESYTANIDISSLEWTLLFIALDDCLVVRKICWLLFVLKEDIDGGVEVVVVVTDELEGCVSHCSNKGRSGLLTLIDVIFVFVIDIITVFAIVVVAYSKDFLRTGGRLG